MEIFEAGSGALLGATRSRAYACRNSSEPCSGFDTLTRTHFDTPNWAPYLKPSIALERGWPIATGVIEGACRHLVKDRMDLTGARWSLDGAEAILKLRALVTNGDFAEYWRFHLSREQQRVPWPAMPPTPSPTPHDLPSEEMHPIQPGFR